MTTVLRRLGWCPAITHRGSVALRQTPSAPTGPETPHIRSAAAYRPLLSPNSAAAAVWYSDWIATVALGHWADNASPCWATVRPLSGRVRVVVHRSAHSDRAVDPTSRLQIGRWPSSALRHASILEFCFRANLFSRERSSIIWTQRGHKTPYIKRLSC